MNERAQLVLLASVVIAIALVPIAFAYLQLGYDADVESSVAVTDPEGDAHWVLVRAVHGASQPIPGEYDWANRSGAADAVRSGLGPRLDTVEEELLEEGIARSLAYNGTAASEWVGGNCPDRPNRQFGDCAVDGGVVLQERANRTHVLAVAVDLETTTPRRESAVTWVLDAW